MTTLLELAERCEREGPSRELDVDILVAAGVLTPHDDPNDAGRLFKRGHYVVALIPWWSVTADGSPVHEVEPVTASLDAAVAFVERVCPRARHGYEQQPDRTFFATIKPRHDGPITRRHEHGQAATPALALVSAALRALAARDE